MKRSKVLAVTVLHFSVQGNLKQSPISGAYKKVLRLRNKGKTHQLVLHFKGRPADIRSCNKWTLREEQMKCDPNDDVVRHHFICTPTECTATVDGYRLHNGVVHFYRGTRRNGGARNRPPRCRPSVAAMA